MKIAWLAPYPINLLTPELKINRDCNEHPSPWIVNLSKEIVERHNIELHIITHTPLISHSQNITKNGINFHIIRYCFPFTNRGFPSYLPINAITLYNGFTKSALKVLKEIEPDIVHAHGTENAYALTACEYDIPSVISLQGIISEILKVNPSFFYLLQKWIELFTIKKSVYFGCRTILDRNFVLTVNKNASISYIPEAISYMYFNNTWKDNSGKNIVFVGCLCKRKGIEQLLKSMSLVKKKIPEVKLRVIGSGRNKYERYLRKLAKKLSLEKNVFWFGYQNPEQIVKHFL